MARIYHHEREVVREGIDCFITLQGLQVGRLSLLSVMIEQVSGSALTRDRSRARRNLSGGRQRAGVIWPPGKSVVVKVGL